MHIITATGRLVTPLDMRAADIRLLDLADMLARKARWAGAAQYTVAEHSIAAVELARATDQPTEVQRWALLHDAAEAYLGDVPAPLRKGLGWYTVAGWRPYYAAELRILHHVAERYRLPWPVPTAVHRIDDRLRATEAVTFFGRPLTQTAKPYGPEVLDPLKLAAAKLTPADAFLALALSLGIEEPEETQ